MTRFVVGDDRSQSTLFPERLDDYLGEDNPVRAVDVFVDELDLSEQARAAIGCEAIEAVADRGYYSGEEIVACEQAGVTVYLPKPITSGLNAKGRFGKQDFLYAAADDVYRCPAGERHCGAIGPTRAKAAR
jgi:hypothetical protein